MTLDIASRVLGFLKFKTISQLRTLNKEAKKRNMFDPYCCVDEAFTADRKIASAVKSLKDNVVEKLAELVSASTVEFPAKLILVNGGDTVLWEYVYQPVVSAPGMPQEHLHRHWITGPNYVTGCHVDYCDVESWGHCSSWLVHTFMANVIMRDCLRANGLGNNIGFLTLTVVDCRPTPANRLRSGH
jgi:hypothetical protein